MMKKFSVVDLQALGLTKIRKAGNNLEIDACVTLQQLLESTHCPAALTQALCLESALNIRNVATVTGALVACDGRSTFATAHAGIGCALDRGPRTTDRGWLIVDSLWFSGIPNHAPARADHQNHYSTQCQIGLRKRRPLPDGSAHRVRCHCPLGWGRTRLRWGNRQLPHPRHGCTESDGIEASINSAQAAAKNAFHGAI